MLHCNTPAPAHDPPALRSAGTSHYKESNHDYRTHQPA